MSEYRKEWHERIREVREELARNPANLILWLHLATTYLPCPPEERGYWLTCVAQSPVLVPYLLANGKKPTHSGLLESQGYMDWACRVLHKARECQENWRVHRESGVQLSTEVFEVFRNLRLIHLYCHHNDVKEPLEDRLHAPRWMQAVWGEGGAADLMMHFHTLDERLGFRPLRRGEGLREAFSQEEDARIFRIIDVMAIERPEARVPSHGYLFGPPRPPYRDNDSDEGGEE